MGHLFPSSGRLAAGLFLSWALASPAWAQTGGLRILVLDAVSGEPLPGVTVTLTNEQRYVAPITEPSDADGGVFFPVLRAGGGYAVDLSMPGFARLRQADLRIASGDIYKLIVRLTRPLEETVRVVGGRDVVDLDQVGGRTRFTQEFIDDLPQRGRLYQDVLPRAAGVNDQDGDGNPNVHGSRTRDFRAEVGGVSNTDPLTGQWLSYVNADSIEELEILTDGAGVEFGRAQGGFARVVQRQGGNDFEGVLNLLFQSSRLDRDGAGNHSSLPPAAFETLQPALQLTGPIVRDQLWFRLSHEQVHREEPVDLLNRVAISTTDQTINSDQVTWQVSPRNKLTFQYRNDPLELDNLGISTSVPPESSRTFKRGGDTLSIGWTAPLSGRLLVDTLIAYQDHHHDLIPTDPEASQRCVYFFQILPLNQALCRNLSQNLTSGGHNETSLDQRQRLTFTARATFYRTLFGQSHQFKFGMVAENERYFRDLERLPEIDFTVVEPPIGNAFGITSVRAYAPRVSRSRATGNSWAVYVEDQWKPSSRLVLTAGLRLDREEIDAAGILPFDPESEAERFATLHDQGLSVSSFLRRVFTAHEDVGGYENDLADTLGLNPSVIDLPSVLSQSGFWERQRRLGNIALRNTYIAPRLSVAWDPFGDGRTKLSVSAGRYFDKIFLAVPLIELDPARTSDSFIARGYPQIGIPFSSFDGSFSLSPLSIRQVDRDLATPYQDEFVAGAERALWAESSITLKYVRRRYRDQLQDIDINHLSGDFGRCIGGTPDEVAGVVASPGEGQTLIDSSTGEEYTDANPGDGDGRIDDCLGGLRLPSTFPNTPFSVPDGRPDLYVQNPAWEEILLLGNFNQSDYEAFVLEFVRRQYRGWEMQANYTWSRARGDAEDFDLALGNEQNLRDDEAGFLDYDQRHVVSLNATSRTPWGVNLGLGARWESGLPHSILVSRFVGFNTPPDYPFPRTNALGSRVRYPTGQRNDQRNPSFWTFDLRVEREFRLAGRSRMGTSFEIFNLLNDDTLTLQNRLTGVNSGQRRFGRRFQLGLRVAY